MLRVSFLLLRYHYLLQARSVGSLVDSFQLALECFHCRDYSDDDDAYNKIHHKSQLWYIYELDVEIGIAACIALTLPHANRTIPSTSLGWYTCQRCRY
jgi:hypothetical protein